MEWTLAYQHQDASLLPARYRNIIWYDRTEFVLREELSVTELVTRAKQVFDRIGLIPVRANLWVQDHNYNNEEKSRRWFSDIAFAFSPAVYPHKLTAQSIPYISSVIIEDLGIVGTSIIEKVVGEEITELIKILPMIIMMFMMMTMMSMFK